jgi:hypothetical protein
VRPLLDARQAIEQQVDDLDRKVQKLAGHNAQVRSFMTVPGVCPVPRSASRRRLTIRRASSDREVLAPMTV